MATFSEGEKTNPADGTILADTGPLSIGTKQVGFIIGASVACKAILQRRNAANDASIEAQSLFVLAGSQQILHPVPFTFAADERIRIVSSGTIVGTVQASLLGYE